MMAEDIGLAHTTTAPGCLWSHMQLDGGTTAPRVFKSPPYVGGHHEFHPTVPMYYLVIRDTEGWEYMAWIGTDHLEGLAFAEQCRGWYGVEELVDLTVCGTA